MGLEDTIGEEEKTGNVEFLEENEKYLIFSVVGEGGTFFLNKETEEILREEFGAGLVSVSDTQRERVISFLSNSGITKFKNYSPGNSTLPTYSKKQKQYK